jgi:hypothetical protein
MNGRNCRQPSSADHDANHHNNRANRIMTGLESVMRIGTDRDRRFEAQDGLCDPQASDDRRENRAPPCYRKHDLVRKPASAFRDHAFAVATNAFHAVSGPVHAADPLGSADRNPRWHFAGASA